MKDTNQTRVDRFTNRLKNHPVTSSIIIIGVVIIAVGGVTGALTNIFQFMGHDTPPTQHNQQVLPPAQQEDPVTSIEEDLMYAKRLTEDWVASVIDRDVEFIMSITQTPFFFDQQVIQDMAGVKNHYLDWWAGEEQPPREILDGINLTAFTVKDFKKEYPRGSFRDRMMNSQLEIKDSDIVVLLDIEGEGTLYFYRKTGDNLKLIGFWG